MTFGPPVLDPIEEGRMRRRVAQATSERVAANVGTKEAATEALAALFAEGRAKVPSSGTGQGFGVPDTSHIHGPRGRTRSQIAKGASAKGAKAERDVLQAFRDVMVNVEAEVQAEGHTFVSRSDFATRKRLTKGTSNRDLGNIPLISIEVKRREQLAINSWWEQTLKQADKGELPVLVYRLNNEAWTVVTWLACTDPLGRVVKYVRASLTLPDFLAYYAAMYREFLKGALT